MSSSRPCLRFKLALAALWRSWGIEPHAVVGHSMGEVAAAYVAGALSLEDAVRVICRRSRLIKPTIGHGAMAAVELSIEEARRVLVGYEDRVSIAASNSPTSTVLSGDPAALAAILDRLQRQDIFCRMVKVDFASHSPQMDPLRADLLQALEGLEPRPASVPIYSTVTGKVSDGRNSMRSIGRGTCESRCSFPPRFSAWWKMGMTFSWKSVRIPFCSALFSKDFITSARKAPCFLRCGVRKMNAR